MGQVGESFTGHGAELAEAALELADLGGDRGVVAPPVTRVLGSV
jgi:hypothetical protein